MSLLNKASLIQIPSGYKDGTLYSAKPTNGDGDFTFSRGSNLAATRINSDGLLEKGRENRLRQSNNFNTLPYAPANATVTSGFEGYDGSNDAWKVASTTIGSETRIRQSQTFTTGEVISLSVYMKKGNVNFGIVRTYAITGGGRAWFDLENGTVATENSGINGSIEDVGNGWYRCSIWGVIDTTGAVDIAPAPADGDYLADAVGEFIYIQDSQLEVGLISTPYIETGASTAQAGILEDMPRLDYSGDCPSLLLEPQRTNAVTMSEYFDGGSLINTTITASYNTADTLSPEGVYNAAKLTATGSFPRYYDFPSTSDNTDIVISSFAKAGDASIYSLFASDKNLDAAQVFFDLSAGTATLAGSSVLTPVGYDIEPMGNGWYRCWLSINTGTGASSVQIRPISHAQGQTGGWSGSNYIYAYGAQYETASYLTSYIPTYGASVTRGADSCSKTGISSLIGQTEGTIFLETYFINTGGNQVLLSPHDGAANKRVEIWSNNNVVNGFIGGSVNIAIGNTTISNGVHKMAVAYKSGDSAFYVDGVQIGTSTTAFTISALTTLAYNQYTGLLRPSESVKQTLLFKTRLSNDELATLTTL